MVAPATNEKFSPPAKSSHQMSENAGPRRTLPPLSALLAFERAAEHLSFRRAADELGLTPSAVSHQIRALEERVGVRLFTRGSGRVGLTAAGSQYLATIAGALAALDFAGRSLTSQAAKGRPELRVSALPFFASTVMLPALGELQRMQPDLELRLEATHAYADFDKPGVDLAIRYGRERSTGLRLEHLLEVRPLPVCAPAVAAGLRCLNDLASAPLIHVQARTWQTFLEVAGVTAPRHGTDIWVDNVTSAIEAAEHGAGLALAMDPLICSRASFGNRLVAPFQDFPGNKCAFYLAMRPEQAHDRRIVVFRRWLRSALAKAIPG